MVKKVCILLATYKRKTSLVKFLNSIIHLRNPFNIELQLLLTVNDNHNYFDILKLFDKKLKIKIIRESKKGISNARNRYLKEIKFTKYDYYAFFDDDVEVNKRWLVEMINFYNKNKVDIVGGPQLTKSKSLFLNLLIREEKHGSNIKWASTNNCLVKEKIFKKRLFFEKKMNLIGGEDQLFFYELYKMGFRIKWNSKATVTEGTDEKREKFIWFFMRNLRYGTSSVLIYKKTHGILKGTLMSLIKSFSDFVRSILYLFFSVLNLKKFLTLFVMYFSRFVGVYMGLLGKQIKEYSK